MKKILIASLVMLVTIHFSAYSGTSKKIESSVKSGTYVPQEIITQTLLKKLPIPASYENYAFIQSIGKVTNVVIGTFTEGEKAILWISDIDADGKVDSATRYLVEQNRFLEVANADKIYTEEKFKELKTSIINGSQGSIAPNPEGSNYLKSLIEKESDVIEVMKYKKGFNVKIVDADDRGLVRASFFYSNNTASGVDLVFIVNYKNISKGRVLPVIKYSVYCKNSVDPYIKEVTQQLSDFTAKYNPSAK